MSIVAKSWIVKKGDDVHYTFECPSCHKLNEAIEFNSRSLTEVVGWCCGPLKVRKHQLITNIRHTEKEQTHGTRCT